MGITLSPKSEKQNLVVDSVAKAGSPRESAEEGFKNKIKRMLISGVKAADVSKAVGVSEGYISQLMDDVNFAKDVQAGRAGNAVGRVNLNAKYDSVEEKLLTRLEQNIPNLYKTNDIVNALRVVGSRKREPIVEKPPEFNGNQVVHLHLSPRIANKFILNGRKDIIGLGEQTFIPMSSLELLKEAKQMIPEMEHTNHAIGYSSNSNEQELRNVSRNGKEKETS